MIFNNLNKFILYENIFSLFKLLNKIFLYFKNLFSKEYF